MNPPGWLVDRLPEWARSIRFRYTLLYSGVLFGLAAACLKHSVPGDFNRVGTDDVADFLASARFDVRR